MKSAMSVGAMVTSLESAEIAVAVVVAVEIAAEIAIAIAVAAVAAAEVEAAVAPVVDPPAIVARVPALLPIPVLLLVVALETATAPNPPKRTVPRQAPPIAKKMKWTRKKSGRRKKNRHPIQKPKIKDNFNCPIPSVLCSCVCPPIPSSCLCLLQLVSPLFLFRNRRSIPCFSSLHRRPQRLLCFTLTRPFCNTCQVIAFIYSGEKDITKQERKERPLREISKHLIKQCVLQRRRSDQMYRMLLAQIMKLNKKLRWGCADKGQGSRLSNIDIKVRHPKNMDCLQAPQLCVIHAQNANGFSVCERHGHCVSPVMARRRSWSARRMGWHVLMRTRSCQREVSVSFLPLFFGQAQHSKSLSPLELLRSVPENF
jgi:hypothetical protein